MKMTESKRTEYIRVYVSKEEKEAFKRKARRKGLKASQWLRSIGKRENPEGVKA